MHNPNQHIENYLLHHIDRDILSGKTQRKQKKVGQVSYLSADKWGLYMAKTEVFSKGQIEALSRVFGECGSGGDISRIRNAEKEA